MTVVWEELWANPPGTPVTVPVAQPAVPAGTQQTWPVGGDLAQLPAADPTARPPQLFRVFDLADPREHILVRDSRTSSWSVTRGDGGTPTVDHAAGFELHNVIAADGMRTRVGGAPSGNGLVLPACGNRSILGPYYDAEYHGCAGIEVPAGEAVPGSVYEAIAWGSWQSGNTGSAGGTPPGTGDARPELYIHAGLGWGLAGIGQSAWRVADFTPSAPIFGQNQLARWRMHGLINIFGDIGPGAMAHASTSLTLSADVDVDRPTPTMLVGPIDNAPPWGQRGIVTDADRTFVLAFALATTVVVGGPATGGLWVCQGGKAWRAA
jgi:hypothetical protein